MDKSIDHEKSRVEVSSVPNGNFDRSWRNQQWGHDSLSGLAQKETVDEKELGPMEAIKYYPAAIAWSLVFSTCVIMEGYDTNLIGNFFGYRKPMSLINSPLGDADLV